MKLYNRTRCPDEIIKPLLNAAGKSVGARVSKVVVKVTQARYQWTRGVVWERSSVDKGEVKGPYNKDGWLREGTIKTDGGFMTIKLPGQHAERDVIMQAVETYKVMQHEWAHVNDFQRKQFITTPTTPSGKRVRWIDRPCEMSAEMQVSEASNPSDIRTLIRNLAIHFKDITQAKKQTVIWRPEALDFGNEDCQEYREKIMNQLAKEVTHRERNDDGNE